MKFYILEIIIASYLWISNWFGSTLTWTDSFFELEFFDGCMEAVEVFCILLCALDVVVKGDLSDI